MSTHFKPAPAAAQAEPTPAPDLSDWISQAEAARAHGSTRQAITKLIKRGRLSVLEVGGKRLVRRSEIEAFEPEKAGRKKAEHDN